MLGIDSHRGRNIEGVGETGKFPSWLQGAEFHLVPFSIEGVVVVSNSHVPEASNFDLPASRYGRLLPGQMSYAGMGVHISPLFIKLLIKG